MKYSKGIIWSDDCRIPFVDGKGFFNIYKANSKLSNPYNGENKLSRIRIVENNKGRFIPNLLVSDDALNDGTVTKTNTKGQNKNNKMNNITDKGSNSRYYDLDLWFNELINKL